jgi:hypothetical protein
MLNTQSGRPIAKITGGPNNGEIICIDENREDGADEIILKDDAKAVPLLNFKERSVGYIAGPSGSGKSTMAANMIKDYLKVHPEAEFYVFSRTDTRTDPAYKGLKINQISMDEKLLNNPIDIEKELSERSILLFDDCNTIQNKQLKDYVDHLMSDIMEVGRKLGITIIMTNHLVIPNERKMARTCLNEMQTMTVFPKSGSSQQISYALKTYFGLSKTQINNILQLPSRWVQIIKSFPMTVIHEKGAYIL